MAKTVANGGIVGRVAHAEYLKCPRCTLRIDQNPDSKTPDTIPMVTKELIGGREAEFVYCPHCGTVLGVLPH